jgi:preprotein translocase subunit SecG
MNRNTRMLIYLFFALGLVIVLLDCSRRMQQRKTKPAGEPQSQSQNQKNAPWVTGLC